mmetsp:Transcript_14826/g.32713  ORF Transcript_14826/g.32713 Transcript_14826/m.32713 type:complete len:210 (+) Transcript_14826:1713-2342(+)
MHAVPPVGFSSQMPFSMFQLHPPCARTQAQGADFEAHNFAGVMTHRSCNAQASHGTPGSAVWTQVAMPLTPGTHSQLGKAAQTQALEPAVLQLPTSATSNSPSKLGCHVILSEPRHSGSSVGKTSMLREWFQCLMTFRSSQDMFWMLMVQAVVFKSLVGGCALSSCVSNCLRGGAGYLSKGGSLGPKPTMAKRLMQSFPASKGGRICQL